MSDVSRYHLGATPRRTVPCKTRLTLTPRGTAVGYTHWRERGAGAAAGIGRRSLIASRLPTSLSCYTARRESPVCAASRGCITAIHTSLLSLANLTEVTVRVGVLSVIVLTLFDRGASTYTNRVCAYCELWITSAYIRVNLPISDQKHIFTCRNYTFERDHTIESIESITTIAIGECESRDTLDFSG